MMVMMVAVTMVLQLVLHLMLDLLVGFLLEVLQHMLLEVVVFAAMMVMVVMMVVMMVATMMIFVVMLIFLVTAARRGRGFLVMLPMMVSMVSLMVSMVFLMMTFMVVVILMFVIAGTGRRGRGVLMMVMVTLLLLNVMEPLAFLPEFPLSMQEFDLALDVLQTVARPVDEELQSVVVMGVAFSLFLGIVGLDPLVLVVESLVVVDGDEIPVLVAHLDHEVLLGRDGEQGVHVLHDLFPGQGLEAQAVDGISLLYLNAHGHDG
jgi:hypothetical protein